MGPQLCTLHPMDLCGCLNLKVLKSLAWNSVLASYPRMSFILRSLSLGDLQFPSVCMLFREQRQKNLYVLSTASFSLNV